MPLLRSRDELPTWLPCQPPVRVTMLVDVADRGHRCVMPRFDDGRSSLEQFLLLPHLLLQLQELRDVAQQPTGPHRKRTAQPSAAQNAAQRSPADYSPDQASDPGSEHVAEAADHRPQDPPERPRLLRGLRGLQDLIEAVAGS